MISVDFDPDKRLFAGVFLSYSRAKKKKITHKKRHCEKAVPLAFFINCAVKTP